MNVEMLVPAVSSSDETMAGVVSGLASPELASLLTVVATSVLVVGLYYALRPSRVQYRLRSFVDPGQQAIAPTASATAAADPKGGSSTMVDVVERRLARRRAIASLRMKLARAGLTITATEFLGLRIGSALAAALIVGVFFAFSMGWSALIAAAVAGLVGGLLPDVVVSFIIRRRMAALEKQIATAIDIVASSLQAGTGLSQGFALLSREMGPPIGEEFAKVLQEVALGLSMTEALMNLANRINSEELDLVVTSIIIQTRVGGNLVHVLRTAAATIREREVLKGEIRTLTAQQRFSAFVIGILPPGVAAILWVMSSNYMGGLFEEGIPRFMLGTAVMLQLMGMYMLNRISHIDV